MKNSYQKYVRLTVIFIFSVVFLVCVSGCSKEVNPLAAKDNSGFAIYLLNNQSLKYSDVKGKEVASLKLKGKPLLNSDDIVMYDFSSHVIFLKGERAFFFGDQKVLDNSLVNTPFVVTAYGKPCYVGSFTSPTSSLLYDCPSIDITGFLYPSDVMCISPGVSTEVDLREDERVKGALISEGKYRGGLSVKLSDVSVVNGDTATVEYKLTFTNNDGNDLYILDPDKTGPGLFHYFTSGPNLYNKNTGKYYSPVYQIVTAPDSYNSFDKEWFTVISAGKSISRTITFKGYEPFSAGVYSVTMNYANPMQISVLNRKIDGGRVWMGRVICKSGDLVIK
jgi:hypothetical protein